MHSNAATQSPNSLKSQMQKPYDFKDLNAAQNIKRASNEINQRMTAPATRRQDRER